MGSGFTHGPNPVTYLDGNWYNHHRIPHQRTGWENELPGHSKWMFGISRLWNQGRKLSNGSPMDVISKNRDPNSTTGVPPELEMIGRCDILPGCAQAAFNRNPDSPTPGARKFNTVRNITNARNAAIRADANRAIRTRIIRSGEERIQVSFC